MRSARSKRTSLPKIVKYAGTRRNPFPQANSRKQISEHQQGLPSLSCKDTNWRNTAVFSLIALNRKLITAWINWKCRVICTNECRASLKAEQWFFGKMLFLARLINSNFRHIFKIVVCPTIHNNYMNCIDTSKSVCSLFIALYLWNVQ